MRPLRALLQFCLISATCSTLAFALQPDRIAGAVDASRTVRLKGNVHGLARPEFDLGRADSGQLMSGVSLAFRPSAAQQSALNKLLAEQQNPLSPNYHKWLTPAQFAERFGMSRNDLSKIISWLQSQGLNVTHASNSRNQVFFEGTVGQIESAFQVEIHNYLVDGELHYANAGEPTVPAALSEVALGVWNLHDFRPRPHVQRSIAAQVDPHFTSYVTGSHYLSPDDFATIYDVNSLYNAGADGAGQVIAVVGQSAINTADVDHFRSAAGLRAKNLTLIQEPGTGTSTVCPGDEGESDLDVEWSGGVAKNASVIFVYVGLLTGETCAQRSFGAFDALQYAIDHNLAPIISNSYGNCEAAIGSTGARTIQGWAQQANSQGQTIVSASGDSGAADCDFHVKSATQGYAVDIPAAIPEVTGAGGSEFTGDLAGTVTGTAPSTNAGATNYWSGTANSTDTLSSALPPIPEMGWNDTTFDIAHGGFLSASGGGASIFFTKPTWQTGTGVPADGHRDVPDISLNASADHDGYLFCSEDGPKGTKVTTCTSGFRDGTGGNLAIVGGTSAAAPTFSAILALINEYLGNIPPGGLGSANPQIYRTAACTPAAFHDITSGDNKVPCTSGSTSCPAGTTRIGFTAGVGYDQVTGLGSPDAFELAKGWKTIVALPATAISLQSPLTQSYQGQSVTLTATVTPSSAYPGTVSFYNGATLLGTATLTSSGVATFSTTSLPIASNSITATYDGNCASANSTSTAITVSVTQAFTLTPSVASLSVTQGASNSATITITPATGFATPLTFSCNDPASESQCTITPPSPVDPSTTTKVTVTVTTKAPTAQLRGPLNRGGGMFYALLLPGLVGIMFTLGSRSRAVPHIRVLSLIVALTFSTLWMAACGNTATASNKDPGTPTGSYTLTISATTGGATPVTGSTKMTLVVVK